MCELMSTCVEVRTYSRHVCLSMKEWYKFGSSGVKVRTRGRRLRKASSGLISLPALYGSNISRLQTVYKLFEYHIAKSIWSSSIYCNKIYYTTYHALRMR